MIPISRISGSVMRNAMVDLCFIAARRLDLLRAGRTAMPVD
jgi:hypothetical protein